MGRRGAREGQGTAAAAKVGEGDGTGREVWRRDEPRGDGETEGRQRMNREVQGGRRKGKPGRWGDQEERVSKSVRP